MRLLKFRIRLIKNYLKCWKVRRLKAFLRCLERQDRQGLQRLVLGSPKNTHTLDNHPSIFKSLCLYVL